MERALECLRQQRLRALNVDPDATLTTRRGAMQRCTLGFSGTTGVRVTIHVDDADGRTGDTAVLKTEETSTGDAVAAAKELQIERV